MVRLSPESLQIDAEKVSGRLEKLLASFFKASGSRGVVVGVSGGLDSSTVLTLTVRALGAERVYAVTMPERNVSNPEDVKDAEELAGRLGVKIFKAEIAPVVEALEQAIPVFNRKEILAWANLKPRIRMVILYYFANRFNLLVAGAGNRTEILMGYFTKFGDGAADFLPLGGLYKTQVRQLASHLGIPRKILDKTPTAGLWPGQTDEAELGIKYETLDLILHGLVDLGLGVEEVANLLGVEASLVGRVKSTVEETAHKRRMAPILSPF
ncbi:MAG: NAD(+) synthetase [Candidatus Hecatellales archaeon]|nr:MAG: NAD(+) synthetase [Candidatus Hecatellales archaeon]